MHTSCLSKPHVQSNDSVGGGGGQSIPGHNGVILDVVSFPVLDIFNHILEYCTAIGHCDTPCIHCCLVQCNFSSLILLSDFLESGQTPTHSPKQWQNM